VNQRARQALADLLDHAAAAARLIGRGRPAYQADEMLRYAAEDLIIRLGEAARRAQQADPSAADAHPELELRQLNDSRNVLAHGYDIVDADIVWEILARDIPRVAAAVKALL
jgi:uncharacterized protein with HEPN domain